MGQRHAHGLAVRCAVNVYEAAESIDTRPPVFAPFAATQPENPTQDPVAVRVPPGKFGAVDFAGGAPGPEDSSGRKSGANTGPDLMLSPGRTATAIALTRAIQRSGNRIGCNKLTASGFKPEALKGQINVDADGCGMRQNRPGSLGGSEGKPNRERGTQATETLLPAGGISMASSACMPAARKGTRRAAISWTVVSTPSLF